MSELNANKGWILIAVGNPIYYKFAFNMAATMRLRLPETGKEATQYPITLLCDGQHKAVFNEAQSEVFDSIITFEQSDIEKIQKQPFYSKTLLYKYSPYEQAAFLDCDAICVGPIDHIFDLTEESFAAVLNSHWRLDQAKEYEANSVRPVEWCSIPEIYQHTQADEKIPFSDINSSLLLFKNDEQAAKIFRSAQYFFETDPPPVRLYGKSGNFPDELAFECAMLECSYIAPRIEKPIHFFTRSQGSGYVSWIQAGKERPIISLFGPKATTPESVWSMYNQLIPNFMRKLEKQNPNKFAPGSLKDGFKNLNPNDKAGAGHDKRNFEKEYKGF